MPRKKRERSPGDEPWWDDPGSADDWVVEFGGEPMLAAGFTESGAPYGVTWSAMRAAQHREAPTAGWARAKRVLEQALAAWTGSRRVEVDRVTKIGEGLYRDTYGAWVDLQPPERSGRFLAVLANERADAEVDARMQHELDVLQRLVALELPFRVPVPVGVVREPMGRLALVRSFVQGIELDLRAGRQGSVQPWQVAGELAAAVHHIDARRLAPVLSNRNATRRDHALAALASLEGIVGVNAGKALAWARAHLPDDEPGVCLHGNLLGSSILLAGRRREPTRSAGKERPS